MTQPFAHFSPLFRGRPSGCRSKAGRPNRPMTSHSGVAAPRPAGAPKRTRSACFWFFGTVTCPCRLAKYHREQKRDALAAINPRRTPASKLFSKDIETMDDLFLHTLQDIYYAEKKIVKSLPDMIETASDAQLKQGFQAHLGETRATSTDWSRCSRCWPETEIGQLPSDRRHHRGGRRGNRRSRRQERTRCSDHRRRPGRRALRDHPLWIFDRLGQAAGSQ